MRAPPPKNFFTHRVILWVMCLKRYPHGERTGTACVVAVSSDRTSTRPLQTWPKSGPVLSCTQRTGFSSLRSSISSSSKPLSNPRLGSGDPYGSPTSFIARHTTVVSEGACVAHYAEFAKVTGLAGSTDGVFTGTVAVGARPTFMLNDRVLSTVLRAQITRAVGRRVVPTRLHRVPPSHRTSILLFFGQPLRGARIGPRP